MTNVRDSENKEKCDFYLGTKMHPVWEVQVHPVQLQALRPEEMSAVLEDVSHQIFIAFFGTCYKWPVTPRCCVQTWAGSLPRAQSASLQNLSWSLMFSLQHCTSCVSAGNALSSAKQ